MPEFAAIILAAGLGTRMRSERAKVLHELGGEPMLLRAMRAVAALAPTPLCVVVGHQAREVEAIARAAFPAAAKLAVRAPGRSSAGPATPRDVAWRPSRAISPATSSSPTAILPMLSPATLTAFRAAHRAAASSLSFITVTPR